MSNLTIKEDIPQLIFPESIKKDLENSLEIAEGFYSFIDLDDNFFEVVFNICKKEKISYFYTFKSLIHGCHEVQKYLEQQK